MATQGPLSPGTIVSDSSFGDVAWVSPGNASASDDARATVTLGIIVPNSEYLKSTNFGFTIPAGATINGIVVEIERSTPIAGQVTDGRVRIVKGGTIGATDRSGGTWPSTDAYASYGSSSDLWGETWTSTDINSSLFGTALVAAWVSASAPVAQVDHVRITVHYTAAANILRRNLHGRDLGSSSDEQHYPKGGLNLYQTRHIAA